MASQPKTSSVTSLKLGEQKNHTQLLNTDILKPLISSDMQSQRSLQTSRSVHRGTKDVPLSRDFNENSFQNSAAQLMD